jgi:hypothetical protein
MRNASIGARTTVSLIVAILLVGSFIAACGSAASAPQAAGAPAFAGSAGASAAPAADRSGAEAYGPDGQPIAGNGDAASAFKDGAKIIRTGSLQLEVADVRAAIGSGRSAIQGMGGYIGASQQYSDGDNIVATITYRIPAERWEDALDALRKLGNEVGEQTDSADVTGQIVDLDARIRNLRASEAALVKHLSDSGKVADVLEIEARLSDVRGQIEQLTAQKTNLDDQVAYATLTVTYGVEVQAVKVAADRWNPQTEIDSAGASLVGFLQLVASAAIWLAIVGLPVLVTLAIVVGLGLLVGRRFGLFRRAAGPPPPAAAEG